MRAVEGDTVHRAHTVPKARLVDWGFLGPTTYRGLSALERISAVEDLAAHTTMWTPWRYERARRCPHLTINKPQGCLPTTRHTGPRVRHSSSARRALACRCFSSRGNPGTGLRARYI